MQEALKIELKVSYWLNTTLPDYEKRLSLKSRLPDETIPRMMLIVGGSCRILVLELLKSQNIYCHFRCLESRFLDTLINSVFSLLKSFGRKYAYFPLCKPNGLLLLLVKPSVLWMHYISYTSTMNQFRKRGV
jgi:hypothetical protein